MNLDLPFGEPSDAELDRYLASIDRELDSLFLDEVAVELDRLRLGGEAASDPAAA